jgi:hypothetical protein
VHYFESDVWYLLGKAPVLQLATEPAGVNLLRRARSAVEDHRAALAVYPTVRAQPLDFIYVCLEGLAALDLALFEDLTSACTWRGVVWGAWLATLAPRSEFLPHLERALPTVPKNHWIVRLAIAALENRDAASEALDCATVIRQALAPLPRVHAPLRRAPDAGQLARMNEERKALREHYRSGGDAAVRAHLHGTLLETYLLPYDEWRRSQAGN